MGGGLAGFVLIAQPWSWMEGVHSPVGLLITADDSRLTVGICQSLRHSVSWVQCLPLSLPVLAPFAQWARGDKGHRPRCHRPHSCLTTASRPRCPSWYWRDAYHSRANPPKLELVFGGLKPLSYLTSLGTNHRICDRCVQIAALNQQGTHVPLNVSELGRVVFRRNGIAGLRDGQPAVLVSQDLADRWAFNTPFWGDIFLVQVWVLYVATVATAINFKLLLIYIDYWLQMPIWYYWDICII